MRNDDSGLSMVELLGYMAIAIVVAVGMFRMYSGYSAKIRRAAAAAQVGALVESARAATYGKKNVKAALTAKLASQGKNTLDPWGNPIEVANGAKCIEVEFAHLSRADCLYLARAITGDCKAHAASINDAAQGECGSGGNSIKWFFAK